MTIGTTSLSSERQLDCDRPVSALHFIGYSRLCCLQALITESHVLEAPSGVLPLAPLLPGVRPPGAETGKDRVASQHLLLLIGACVGRGGPGRGAGGCSQAGRMGRTAAGSLSETGREDPVR